MRFLAKPGTHTHVVTQYSIQYNARAIQFFHNFKMFYAPPAPLCVCVRVCVCLGDIQYFYPKLMPHVVVEWRAGQGLACCGYISKLLLSICRLLIENNTIKRYLCASLCISVCVCVCVEHLAHTFGRALLISMRRALSPVWAGTLALIACVI